MENRILRHDPDDFSVDPLPEYNRFRRQMSLYFSFCLQVENLQRLPG